MSKKYDLSSILQLIRGHEIYFANALQDAFGVEVTWDASNTNILATCVEPELLQIFDQSFKNLCSNPDSVRALLPCIPSCTIDITTQAQLIIGENNSVIKWLEREYAVSAQIRRNPADNKILLQATASTNEAIELFERTISYSIQNPLSFSDRLKERMSKKVHMFVDVSNILLGAQFMKTGERDHNISIAVPNIVELVTGLRSAEQRVAVGSIPSRENPFWREWEQLNFKIYVMERVGATGHTREQGVDDVLHAQMLQTVSSNYSSPRTVVLLTGDGNSNYERTSFPEVLERAMINGWSVELWSWSLSTSNVYKRFKDFYPNRCTMLRSHSVLFFRALHLFDLTWTSCIPRISEISNEH